MVVVELEFGADELIIVSRVVDGRAQHLSAVSPEPVLQAAPSSLKYEESSEVDDALTVKPKRDAVPVDGSIHEKSVDVAVPSAGV
jgi:hypothetical protein